MKTEEILEKHAIEFANACGVKSVANLAGTQYEKLFALSANAILHAAKKEIWAVKVNESFTLFEDEKTAEENYYIAVFDECGYPQKYNTMSHEARYKRAARLATTSASYFDIDVAPVL